MNKIAAGAGEALAGVFDGAVIMCGGFGCVGGMPSMLFRALSELPVRDLTLIGNAPVLGLEAQKTAARTMTVPESFADGSPLLKNRQVGQLIVYVPDRVKTRNKQPFPL